jgi:glycerol-3-phosphate dehydrogenase
VVWTYAGVRPLFDDGKANVSAVTRDYVLDLETPTDAAPLLTIYGGKITTFRELGERALDLLKSPLGVRHDAWTRTAPLPGGDLKIGFDAFRQAVAAQHPWLVEPHLTRLCRAYGSRIALVLGDAQSWAELGHDYGAGLTQREIDYLKRYEWARSADDVLWRRTKLGLHMTPTERAAVAGAFASVEMTEA